MSLKHSLEISTHWQRHTDAACPWCENPVSLQLSCLIVIWWVWRLFDLSRPEWQTDIKQKASPYYGWCKNRKTRQKSGTKLKPKLEKLWLTMKTMTKKREYAKAQLWNNQSMSMSMNMNMNMNSRKQKICAITWLDIKTDRRPNT